ncbi:hypothetical protein NliqN6_3758 [Naganishia liquefaciens]|uniref:RING-type domain-containing protein n=1 Tax=Naganishia liquefaciens TaxID=104408 RepID=A0A8H3YH67_9TREE|nr:hypothetical protein NliqN6_3758 [Naganishia liquefaciens]
MPRSHRGPARNPRSMPLIGRARRRLALTSALNNPTSLPDAMDAPSEASDSLGPTFTLATGRLPPEDADSRLALRPLVSNSSSSESKPLRHEQRKRRRIQKEDSEEHLAPVDHGVADSSAKATSAGSSSLVVQPDTAIPTVNASISDTAAHFLFANVRTTQEQLRDRSELLAAQERNAKLEARMATLGKEVAFKNDNQKQLLSGHHSTLERFKQNFTCNICFELFRDPHAVVPCGHTACAPCLLQWFGSINSLLRPPQQIEDGEIAEYLRKHTKCCFTCRAAVTYKPIPSYILQDTVQALSLQMAVQDSEMNPAEAFPQSVMASGDRATMWDAVFKPTTRQRWFVDEEDHGVRRCGSCGYELDGRWCLQCDEVFSDISDVSGSEHYSSDDSLAFRIPHAFFPGAELEGNETRWPGEESDDDDEDEFYGRAREWQIEPDDRSILNQDLHPNIRLVARQRPRNTLQRQDFQFDFGGTDLDHRSSDGGDTYEGSFIDDEDDSGMERHFVRGDDYDREDSDPSDFDISGSDRSGSLDRYGRPTHLAGRQVAYSPSHDGSSQEDIHIAGAGHSHGRSMQGNQDGSGSGIESWDERMTGNRPRPAAYRVRTALANSLEPPPGGRLVNGESSSLEGRLEHSPPIRRTRRRIISATPSEDD